MSSTQIIASCTPGLLPAPPLFPSLTHLPLPNPVQRVRGFAEFGPLLVASNLPKLLMTLPMTMSACHVCTLMLAYAEKQHRCAVPHSCGGATRKKTIAGKACCRGPIKASPSCARGISSRGPVSAHCLFVLRNRPRMVRGPPPLRPRLRTHSRPRLPPPP